MDPSFDFIDDQVAAFLMRQDRKGGSHWKTRSGDGSKPDETPVSQILWDSASANASPGGSRPFLNYDLFQAWTAPCTGAVDVPAHVHGFSSPHQAVEFWEARLAQLDDARSKVLQQLHAWKQRLVGVGIHQESLQWPSSTSSPSQPVASQLDASFCEPVDSVVTNEPTLFMLCESPVAGTLDTLRTSTSACTFAVSNDGRGSDHESLEPSFHIHAATRGQDTLSEPHTARESHSSFDADGVSELGDLWVAPKVEAAYCGQDGVADDPPYVRSAVEKHTEHPQELTESTPRGVWTPVRERHASDDTLLKSPGTTMATPSYELLKKNEERRRKLGDAEATVDLSEKPVSIVEPAESPESAGSLVKSRMAAFNKGTFIPTPSGGSKTKASDVPKQTMPRDAEPAVARTPAVLEPVFEPPSIPAPSTPRLADESAKETVPTVGPLVKPTPPVIEAAHPHSALLSWKPCHPDAVYTVQFCVASLWSLFGMTWTQAGQHLSTTRFEIMHLSPSTSYYARIGASLPTDPAEVLYSESSVVFTTPAEVVIIPKLAKPGTPRCVSKRATALAWEWDGVLADVPHPPVTYKLEFAQSGLLSVLSAWQVACGGTADTSASVLSLHPGTPYYVRVTATCGPTVTVSDTSETVTTLTEAEEARLDKEAALELARHMEEERKRLEAEAEQQRCRAAEAMQKLQELQASSQTQLEEAVAELERQRKLESDATKLKLSQLKAQAQQGERDRKLRQDAEAALTKKAREADAARAAMRTSQDAAAHLKDVADQQSKLAQAAQRKLEAHAAELQLTSAQLAELRTKAEELEELKRHHAEHSKVIAEQVEAEARRAAAAEAEKARTEAAAATLEAELNALRGKLSEVESSSASVTATSQAAIAALYAQLRDKEAESARVAAEAKRVAEAEAAASAAASAAAAEKDRLQASIADMERDLDAAAMRAAVGNNVATSATESMLAQQAQMEDLLRYLRYKDTLISSLQGVGPNPALETELISRGHTRETVRFFLELQGDDKETVTALLDRHKAFVVRGFDTDGVREALVVVKNGTDADIEAYLHTFEQRVAKFKALSALLRAESK